MKKTLLLLIVTLMFCGCSKDYLVAKYYLIRADEAYTKAYSLRVKPNADAERMGYYRKAHDYFLKAYELRPDLFNLIKIEQAHDACLRLEDKEGQEIFQRFAEEYSKTHPTEAEYGDATSLMGGIE